ncbi:MULTISPECIES: molybdenum cofactor guanylyltransferase MobA [Shewanella]|uniref:Molybdenum cofactor guanylyltransferase n=1 Tax=Shewanella japonica TaxID=93973 RepID=A0ABN4Y7D5_9GAMM|nr:MULTISPECIES: molybdenum cofactor guanylyltransferase MobA [Shewanella]ARD20421.1 Molybdenum cofactor guanylyltransferase [Shewanella japonica]KPZ68632.1 Molybdenum cofactor guanylyltransferase [Shewanella sp. P1-14-1]MBQ4890346.1 molybdenum cofactor guanylyltransferase [Shewanella sp. MMG014]OBT05530.1 molybdenum cofactor guanylyltransferase MobA [Shewanella sp. UCD-FRSSP16_17]
MSVQIDAVILAGGMARRMGGIDKGLVELSGKPMIAHTIARVQPQVDRIMINANRSQAQYAELGFDVLSDQESGYLGPLAGMVTAMNNTDADLLLVVPCDSPMLPTDLCERMYASLKEADADIVVASDGEHHQPVVLLLKPHLKDSMQAFLDAGDRKIFLWYEQHKYVVTSFADQPNAFVNVNTLEQKLVIENAK